MPGDGLFDPLGVNRPEPVRPTRMPSPPRLVAAVAALAVAALVALSWLRDDGDRGRPRAIAPIERVAAPPKPAAPPPPPPAPNPPPAAAAPPPPPGFPAAEDQEVEVQNGVRIIRPRRDGATPPTGQFTPATPPPAQR